MASAARKPARRKAKQARSQETVAAILEGAAQVLLREGYARATTNRIAERAGVSVGSIYQYFDGKDRVFEALIRRETGVVERAVTREAPDPTWTLERSLARILSLAIAASPRAPELMRELDRVPDGALDRALKEARGRVVAFIRDVLEHHRDRLTVRDLDLAASLIVGAAEGIARNTAAEDYVREHFVSEVGRMLTRYLTATP